jgi:hypothetical protein
MAEKQVTLAEKHNLVLKARQFWLKNQKLARINHIQKANEGRLNRRYSI